MDVLAKFGESGPALGLEVGLLLPLAVETREMGLKAFWLLFGSSGFV
jgi:hypothetical protein